MIPFLASTLQAPFLHLGTQFPDSSLSHPDTPSLVTFARPLWRLWELFDKREDVSAYCTQSAPELFEADSRRTGASLLVDRRGNMLLVVANFAPQSRRVRVRLNWAKAGLRPGRHVWQLTSRYTGNAAAATSPGKGFEADVEGYGVAGWLIATSPAGWKAPLARFCRPYPTAPKEERAWASRLAHIRKLRFEPPCWKRCFLRVSVRNWPNTYEDSVWYDLFANTVSLNDVTQRDHPIRLGLLSQKGLGDKTPAQRELIWPGSATPWIPLHSLPGASRPGMTTQLELATCAGQNAYHAGQDFYSLVKVELSPVASRVKQTYEVVYNNDIDLDWSRLRFAVRLEKR
jgi:hypothetical protein